ncbi:R3H domain-containing nucleic acid-binding protein [Phycicoccus sp. Root101]|uniref:Jag family protein n=1 Tax=Phycicoccus sp. Root101 TaxID=1736421 RepID=UPI000A6721CA|nr:R3H domain-containing nucleic acid-binding protein [Phycicoccus sp. Root101]
MTEHHDTVVDETSQAGQTEVAASTDATPAGDATDAHAAETDTVSAHSEASETETETEADPDSDDATDATGAQDAGASGSTSRRRPAKTADLEREGEVAADFLETLLDIADLDGDIDVDVDGDRAAVSIVDSDEGRVPRRLVGPDGKVLDALQELTRLAVQSATGERSRLMLDVAGHRAERRAALVTIAQKAIADVKASGQQASLEPMTAFERKVVHDEVLAAGLVSESDGVEPRRFVVVLPG